MSFAPRNPSLGHEPNLAHGFRWHGILFRDRFQSPEPLIGLSAQFVQDQRDHRWAHTQLRHTAPHVTWRWVGNHDRPDFAGPELGKPEVAVGAGGDAHRIAVGVVGILFRFWRL